MELMRQETPLNFEWKDGAVLHIKPKATAYDRFLIDVSAAGKIDGDSVRFEAATFYRVLVERFVVGWSGITEEGRPVPYSLDVLLSRFPSDKGDDLFLSLGNFIIEKTDIFKRDILLKNGLGRQANGSTKQEPLTVAAQGAQGTGE